VRIRRGGHKRPVVKGQTYGKPKSHGVNQLKLKHSLQAIAEVYQSSFHLSFNFVQPIPNLFLGQGGSQVWRTTRAELLLGCPRLDVQVLRGDSGRPGPQDHP